MSYLGAGVGGKLSPEQLAALCNMLGLPVVTADAQALANALRDQLAAVEQLDRLPLECIEPALWFDPRWTEPDA